MSDDEIAALDDLEEAHARKTRLAMDIIRTLDRRARRGRRE